MSDRVLRADAASQRPSRRRAIPGGEAALADSARLLADPRIIRYLAQDRSCPRKCVSPAGAAAIARLVRPLTGRASPPLGCGLEEALSPDVSLCRQADRPRIPDECRLSPRSARAGLPGLCSDPRSRPHRRGRRNPHLCRLSTMAPHVPQRAPRGSVEDARARHQAERRAAITRSVQSCV